MRLGRLLVLAILVLVAGRTAASQEIQTQDNNSVDSRHSSAPAPTKDFGVRANTAQAPAVPEEGTSLCLTMHTIRVSRPHGMDAGHVIGESTCTPAVRFQMKSADAKPSQQK